MDKSRGLRTRAILIGVLLCLTSARRLPLLPCVEGNLSENIKDEVSKQRGRIASHMKSIFSDGKPRRLAISSPCMSKSASSSPTPSATPSTSITPSATPSSSASLSPSPSSAKKPVESDKQAIPSPSTSVSPSQPPAAASLSPSSTPGTSPMTTVSATPSPITSGSASVSPASSTEPSPSISPSSTASISPSNTASLSSSPIASMIPSDSASASPFPTASISPSDSGSASPAPTSSPSPSSQCDATCRCEDPGNALGSDSFDESELVNYETSPGTSLWSTANFDLPDIVFRSDPKPANVAVNGGELTMQITEENGVYSGAGIRTQNSWYGYGCVSACMKPSGVSGIISSLFTYTSKWDGINGSTPNHNEIDIEFEGQHRTKVQFNYYVDKLDSEVQQNEFDYDLGFDASQSFNVYGFKWTPWGIQWYVNGNNVYTKNNEGAKGTPIVEATTVQKVMANLWVVSEDIENYFGGPFDEAAFNGTESKYKWIRYEKLDEFGCCPIAASC